MGIGCVTCTERNKVDEHDVGRKEVPHSIPAIPYEQTKPLLLHNGATGFFFFFFWLMRGSRGLGP